jgi:hypothetical protein
MTAPSNATYSIDYDVEGWLRRRSAPGDEHTYTYTTSAASVQTTETPNGTVVRRSSQDFLGRSTGGETDSNAVSIAYTQRTTAPAGIQQNVTPVGQSLHSIVRDFLGVVAAESHPETGDITDPISAEGWIEGVVKPTCDYRYDLDAARA